MSGISPLLLGSAALLGAVLLVVITLGALGSLVLVAKALIKLQSEALGALKVLIADISQARVRQDGHQSAIMAEILAAKTFTETRDLQATAGILGHHAHHEQAQPAGQPAPGPTMEPIPQGDIGPHVGEDFVMPGEEMLKEPPSGGEEG